MSVPPILYAEDNSDDIFFMQRALEKAGLPNPLVAVRDGKQAIDYLAGEEPFTYREKHPLPSLLLLDLGLPIRSGFEVLHWVRAHPTLRNLNVVIVSASAQETDIDLAGKIGVLDYVVKPTRPARLVEIVQERKGKWLTDCGLNSPVVPGTPPDPR